MNGATTVDTKRFCREHQITSSAVRTDGNPNMDSMPRGSAHYLVTLRRQLHRQHDDDPQQAAMVVPFSMGPGLTHWPKAVEVLDCLASDANFIEDARDFEEWADELGFLDPPPRHLQSGPQRHESSADRLRRARRTYEATQAQTAELMRFLTCDDGQDPDRESCQLYTDLLFETERL